MIPAEIVEQYVDNSTETLNFDLIAAPEGIFIEIGGGESCVSGVMLYCRTRRFEMASLWQPSNQMSHCEPSRTNTSNGRHDFAVTVGGSDHLLGASNKTLMWMLKEHLPLAGKTLKLTRSGHGFETQYMVEEVQHKKHWRTKPLTRLCDMMHVAIALLGVLRELLDWL